MHATVLQSSPAPGPEGWVRVWVRQVLFDFCLGGNRTYDAENSPTVRREGGEVETTRHVCRRGWSLFASRQQRTPNMDLSFQGKWTNSRHGIGLARDRQPRRSARDGG